jgi:hypothetical protein
MHRPFCSPAGRLLEASNSFGGVRDDLIQAGGSALGELSLDCVCVEPSPDHRSQASTERLEIRSEESHRLIKGYGDRPQSHESR